jgi:citronellol/citronellal dehydrogenase
MGSCDGRVAIVTGASRGIGAAIARLLAAEGAKVACAARTLREGEHPLAGSLETTVAQIRERGGQAAAFACNVAEPADCDRLVAEVREAYGPCDILVNNAALTYYQPVVDMPYRRWERSFAVNVHAPFYLSHLVLPEMCQRGSGHIINISSGAAIGPGRGPYPPGPVRGGSLYGAEKAAIERFSQGLAQEVYGFGVAVSSLAPSQVVPTPGTVYHHLVESLDDPRGEPPELMARAALILATEPAEKVSGRVVYSQQLLLEYGQIAEGRGLGVERPGSGFSRS